MNRPSKPGIAVAMFALIPLPLLAQNRLNQPSAHPATEIRAAGGCITLDSRIQVEGLQKVYKSLGEKAQVTYQLHGQITQQYPAQANALLTISPNCVEKKFMLSWPDFVKDLDFTFTWEWIGAAQKPFSRPAPLISREHDSPLWSEGPPSRTFTFAIPSDNVPLTAHLKVKIYVSDKLALQTEVPLHAQICFPKPATDKYPAQLNCTEE